MKIDYIESPPNKWTFQPPQIRKWIENHLEGTVLNLFAGKTKLKHNNKIVRNDIDANIDADYHFDAMRVNKHFESNSFDTIIFDPPYNLRKAREKYEDRFYKGKLTIIKEKCIPLLKVGGIFIHFGYDTTGMGKSRGFKKEAILIINHKGDHNDTLAVIDRKVQTSLI